jgi:hypothetical protein
MRGTRRRGLQRRGDQRFDLLVTHYTRPARSRLVEQSITAPGGEPVAPLGNRVPIQFQSVGDLDIAAAVGARQHDSGPQGQPSGTVATPNPTLQLGAFIPGQHDFRGMR